jgi:hypothetical protein
MRKQKKEISKKTFLYENNKDVGWMPNKNLYKCILLR